MSSFQLGVKYHFLKDKQWGFNTGISMTLMSQGNFSFSLKEEDVYANYEGFEGSAKEYGDMYISIPLNVEFKKRIKQKVYFNFNTGINIYFLRRGGVEFIHVLVSEELQEKREGFALYENTQHNQLQVSAIFSTGLYFTLNKFMLQTNIIYNKTFQNLLEGEYQFGNLFVSEPTRGDYIISGDFIGLSTTVYFKKRDKNKKRKGNKSR